MAILTVSLNLTSVVVVVVFSENPHPWSCSSPLVLTSVFHQETLRCPAPLAHFSWWKRKESQLTAPWTDGAGQQWLPRGGSWLELSPGLLRVPRKEASQLLPGNKGVDVRILEPF